MTPGEHEPYCGAVEERVSKSLEEIKAEQIRQREITVQILEKVAVLSANKPPCESMEHRVGVLENSDSYLRGKISLGASIGAGLIAIGTAVFVALFKR